MEPAPPSARGPKARNGACRGEWKKWGTCRCNGKGFKPCDIARKVCVREQASEPLGKIMSKGKNCDCPKGCWEPIDCYEFGGCLREKPGTGVRRESWSKEFYRRL